MIPGQMGSVEPPAGSGSVLVSPGWPWPEQLQRKKTSAGQEVPGLTKTDRQFERVTG